MIVIDYDLLTCPMKLCTISSYVLELCSTLSRSPETSDDTSSVSSEIGLFHISVCGTDNWIQLL
jgi:hypothetical protein